MVREGGGALPVKESARQHKVKVSETGSQRYPGRQGEGSRVTRGLAVTSGVEVTGDMGQGILLVIGGWGSWWFCESGETCFLPTAPVVTQLEAGHFFDASITKQHLFASVHDAVVFALQHPRSGPVSPVSVS